MSHKCSTWVYEHSESTGNDRLVLLAIADEANDEGSNAFPSIRRLASKARCHTDTVIECIKRLEALGELEVIRPEKQGRGRFNRYNVIMEKVGNSDLSQKPLARVPPAFGAGDPPFWRGSTRANPTDPTNPRLARIPPPKPECETCDGTGWQRNDAGDYTWVSCAHGEPA